MKGCKKIILSKEVVSLTAILVLLSLTGCGGTGPNSTYIISDTVRNPSADLPVQEEPIR